MSRGQNSVNFLWHEFNNSSIFQVMSLFNWYHREMSPHFISYMSVCMHIVILSLPQGFVTRFCFEFTVSPRVKRAWCSCCSTYPPDVPTPWDVPLYEEHIISSLLFFPATCPLLRQHQSLLQHLCSHEPCAKLIRALITAAEFLYPNAFCISVLGRAYSNLRLVAGIFICARLQNAYFTLRAIETARSVECACNRLLSGTHQDARAI